MVFAADALGAWLVGQLADAGRRRLTSWMLGSEQDRALHQAATVAIQRTAAELQPDDCDRREQLEMVINQVFAEPVPSPLAMDGATLLEALQTAMARQLAPLDDPDLTGTGRSSADLLGFPGQVLTERLSEHLIQEIVVRGARGGPLEPFAAQVNHDITHLQGQRLEGVVDRLAKDIRYMLMRLESGAEALPFPGEESFSGAPESQGTATMPPPPALPVEIPRIVQLSAVIQYLKTLIEWLSIDPWPQDRRFGGRVLPTATIERLRRLDAVGPVREQDDSADEWIRRCQRLVILGEPGTGKTWLVKRAARLCAEEALRDLASGRSLNEIELPIYTTCARLFTAHGTIREAVVSSALIQLSDIGGSRLSAALYMFFTERNAPTLLLIDSLDEAQGSDERLHQAGSLPWRIILTSRPTSWNHQLGIDKTDKSHRIAELQALRYPEDVTPFIESWFAQRPEWARELAAQIARRPSLQQGAIIPLILAFYCILASDKQLPEFTHDLYARVLNRMLTGGWRSGHVQQPNLELSLNTLRTWAWKGAINRPVSGVAEWQDDIVTGRGELGSVQNASVDHIATPLYLPNIDTDKTLRRFVHRSIREYLVAAQVAMLPVHDAVEVLLPHLWYDPDWERSAPMAIAMHPNRDDLIQNLLCRAARSNTPPMDLTTIDVGWQFRRILAQVASESHESDWSPAIAGIIEQGRIQLAQAARATDISWAPFWPNSSRQARKALLAQLAGVSDAWTASELADALTRLGPTSAERSQAIKILLRAMVASDTDEEAAATVHSTIELAKTPAEKRHVRETLLRLMVSHTDLWLVIELAGGIFELTPGLSEARQTREILLRLLASATTSDVGFDFGDKLLKLDLTPNDKHRAREMLIALLAAQVDSIEQDYVLITLPDAILKLDPTAEDKRRTCELLLALLDNYTENVHNSEIIDILQFLVQLNPAVEDKIHARERALEVAATCTRSLRDVFFPMLVRAILQLDPTDEAKHRTSRVLLALLVRNGTYPIEAIARSINLVDPAASDEEQNRAVLLAMLLCQTNFLDEDWASIFQLNPTAEDKWRAREALIALVGRHPLDAEATENLIRGIARLDPSVNDKLRARRALVSVLIRQTNWWPAVHLIQVLRKLDPSSEDKRQARAVLLGLIISYSGNADGNMLQSVLYNLNLCEPTADDKLVVRRALLRLLSRPGGAYSSDIISALVGLDLTPEDKRHTRKAMIRLLAIEPDSKSLMWGVSMLEPTVDELSALRLSRIAFSDELLAAARRNTALAVWLEALPSLKSILD